MTICGCSKGEKHIVLWEFHAKNEQFLHLHKGNEIHVKKKTEKEQTTWRWAVKVQSKGKSGLVNPAYLVPKKVYEDASKYAVYRSKWFVDDVNPVESLMEMSERGENGEFLILAPNEYKLIASGKWIEYLLLVRVGYREGNDTSLFQWDLVPDSKDPPPTVLGFRIRRNDEGEYTVVEGRNQLNLYSLVNDLMENGIPGYKNQEALKLTAAAGYFGLDQGKVLVPAPPIDPDTEDTFDQPEDTTDEKKLNKIERNRLKMDKTPVGHGEFGVVYRGKWIKNDYTDVTVAVKCLKSESFQIQTDLDQEIRLMGRLQNKYLVKLYGICTERAQRERTMIVAEFLEMGPLHLCLRSREEEGKRLPLRGLLEILYQVACGMGYLEQERVIHRDLAARNILVSSISEWSATVKISDFGMSRILTDNEYYRTNKKRLPWKWMAIESICTGKFNSKTDVWSFGVLCFEVLTHGGKPYEEMTNELVFRFLREGRRLQKEETIPDFVWNNLCDKCWLQNPDSRPSFKEIVRFLNNLLFNSLKLGK